MTARRRRARSFTVVAILAIVFGSCGIEATHLASTPTNTAVDDTASTPTTAVHHPAVAPPSNLVAIALNGVLVWDPDTGSALLDGRDAIPSGDWTTVVSMPPAGPPPNTVSTVTASDVTTGAQRWTATVDARLRPRLASHRGDLAVVMAEDQGSFVMRTQTGDFDARAQTAYHGRSQTTMLVVGEDGRSRPYTVDANVEPEAFSLDGSALFVIQYTPAEAPTAYRVRQLDLDSGALHDVYTVDRQLLQDMPGSARRQVRARDGKRLYTLYTERPDPAHSSSAATEDDIGRPNVGHAFVHVLDTEQKWAMCVDLPLAFAGGSQTRGAIAVSADGDTVVIADAENRVVASVDTQGMAVTEEAPLGLPDTGDQTAVTVAADGAIYAGTQHTVQELDPVSLVPRSSMTVGTSRGSGPLASLDASTRPGLLAAASTSDWALLYDTRDRRVLRPLAMTPNLTAITHLGPTESRLWRVPESDKCTC